MSSKWVIKDAGGNITNPCITAEESFVAANFEYYEAFVPAEVPDLTAEQEARRWRNGELNATDTFHLLDDYPNAANLTSYRAALRAWPSTSDFPDTKPTLS